LYPRSVPHDLNKMDVSGYIACGRRENGQKSGSINAELPGNVKLPAGGSSRERWGAQSDVPIRATELEHGEERRFRSATLPKEAELK
ncbi:MAG TPA: hypothetical protein VKO45_04860, partial [Methanomicrobiales archaeon]|nr:hypothetical protein [Methanomicrobiales archaeon]